MPRPAQIARGPVLARAGQVRDVVLVAFAVYAAAVHFVDFRDYVFEDAYITYRYADNLAHGLGFAFNPGERVLGTSTPLYTVVLAILGRLGLHVPTAGALFYAAGLSLVALAGAWVLRRYGFPNLGALYAVIVLWNAGDVLKYFGMETTLYVSLLFATLIAALERRPVATGLFLGLAFLTRYDAFLLVVPLFAVLWIAERRLPWRAAVTAALVVAPWLLGAWLYFGTVLPNTLPAKAGDVTVARYLYDSVKILLEAFFHPLARLTRLPFPHVVWSLLVLALIGPVFAQAVRVVKRETRLALLLVFPLLLWCGYAIIGPPLDHRWYLVPGMYFFLVLSLLSWGFALASGGPGPPRWLGTGLTLALLAVSWGFLTPWVGRELVAKTHSPTYRKRVLPYSTFARLIDAYGLNDLRLLTREPGYLAFRTKNPVIDGAGLVTPGVYFHGDRDRVTTWEELIETYRPGLIVGNERAVLEGDPEGYLPLYFRLGRSLHVEQEAFQQRLPVFLERWFSDAYTEEVTRAHPLAFDFDDDAEGWIGTESVDFVGAPKPLLLDGQPWESPYLHSHGSGIRYGLFESPPFRIDFDELSFLFSGNARNVTWAELLVQGVRVLRLEGRQTLTGRLKEVTWPVHAWRGQVGVLRFVDALPQGTLVAADRVRSSRWEGKTSFDDFESGAYGERWKVGFGNAPCPAETLARLHGLPAVLGRYTATSLCFEGVGILASRPFRVEHDFMALAVLDYGGRRTRVELQAGERIVRRFDGSKSKGPVGLIWDVSEVRGQEVVLRAVDRDRSLRRGIGIDDVVFFDAAGDAQSSQSKSTTSSIPMP